MKLIYAWVENFRNLEKVGFNISSKYNVSYDDINKKVIIEKKDKFIPDYGNVDEITAIIGKNGSGKTNLLDLLSFKYYKRLDDKIGHFFIYHLEGNSFIIEGYKKNLTNIPIPEDAKELYTVTFSYDFNSNISIFEFYTQFEDKLDNKMAIVNIRRFFKSGYNFRSFELDDIKYFFPRFNMRYDWQMSNYNKYNFIIDIRSHIPNVLSGTYKMQISFDNNYSNEIIKELDFIKLRESNNHTKRSFIINFLKSIIYSSFSSLKERDYYEKNNKNGEFLREIKEISVTTDIVNYYLDIFDKIMSYMSDNESMSSYIYETEYNGVKEVVYKINELNNEYFKSNTLEIPLRHKDRKTLKLLKIIDKYKLNDIPYLGFINIQFLPFSSGEEVFIDIYSMLIGLRRFSQYENLIILLDEPDNFMHPEWSRRFISLLLKYLNYVNEMNFQIIVTTHSPFIISDLVEDNVITIDVEKETGNCRILTNSIKQKRTFASNIHTLLSSTFFMESTIGKYAEDTINELITLLNRKRELTKEENDYVRNVINIIEEPLIKGYLSQLYEKRLPLEERIERINLQIKELKNQREKLERDDYFD
ncbi:MAG: AAA family ATPase [bacterium]